MWWPSSDRTRFTLKAEAVAAGEDYESAEAPLQHWLDDWLQESKMCSSGYTITTIDRIKTFAVADGGSYRVLMQGRCNSPG